jgi:hypothetical protein
LTAFFGGTICGEIVKSGRAGACAAKAGSGILQILVACGKQVFAIAITIRVFNSLRG